jgi:ssDNA thymidine ADP-ribosyltransferase, DarT
MELAKIKVYRMTHIGNIPHILKYGITHRNSVNRNPDFIEIGDSSLIRTREGKKVKVDNGDFTRIDGVSTITLGDFIPFYFWVKMPMLFTIRNGGNFVQNAMPAEDIVYLVCSLNKLTEVYKVFYFSDGHATNNLTTFYDNTKLADLPQIVDWDAVKAPYWGGQDNLNVKRKKQAELLLLADVSPGFILGYGCYNEFAHARLIQMGISKEKIKVIPQAYY